MYTTNIMLWLIMMSIFDVMYHGVLHSIAIIFENIYLYNQQLLRVCLCFTNCMNTDYSSRNCFIQNFHVT